MIGLLAMVAWPDSWRSIAYSILLTAWVAFEFHRWRLRSVSMYGLVLFWLVLTYVLEPIGSGYMDETLHDSAVPLAVFLFVGAISLGYATELPRRIAATWKADPRPWEPESVQHATLALAILAIGLWGLFLALAHTSPVEMLYHSLEVRVRVEQELPDARWIRDFAIWFSWAPFFVELTQALAKPPRPTSWFRLGTEFCVLEAWMLLLGQRWVFFAPAVVTVLLLADAGKLKLTALRVVAAGLAGTALSFVLVMYRTRSLIGAVDWKELFSAVSDLGATQAVQQGLRVTSSRMDKLGTILHGVPSSLPFAWGDSYIGVVMLFVPRRFVPWKPMYTDDAIQAALFPGFDGVGLAFGGIAEAYYNFGWLGIVAIGLLSGMLIRLCDQLLSRDGANPVLRIWFSQAGFLLPVMIVGGWFGVTAIQFVFYSLLSWVVTSTLTAGKSLAVARIPA